MDKLRILAFSHSADMGGAEIVLWDIIRSLDPRRFEIHLAVPHPGPLEDKARLAGFPVHRGFFRPWLAKRRFAWRHIYHALLNVAGLPGLVLLIKGIKPDVVLSNSCTILSAALASCLCRVPHIWYVHETVSDEPEAFRFWAGNGRAFRIIDRTGARIVTDSDYVRSTFPGRIRKRITTVYYGFEIPPERTPRIRKSAPASAAWNAPGETIIAVMGVICERKGQLEAAQAMPLLLRDIPSARLVFAGSTYPPDAGYRRRIEEFVSSHGLADKVRFLGFMDAPGQVYETCDCVLVPSKVEPFGRIVVEAMLHRVPVVAAKIGGIPEIIRDGETGTLFTSWSGEAIAHAVKTALGRPDLVEMTERAYQDAKRRFSMASMTKKIEAILLETAGRTP